MTIKFSPPHKVTAKVISSKYLNKIDIELTLEMVHPESFEFIAGQFITLNCGNQGYRAYSIGSSSLDNKHISLIVAVGHEGIGSNYIKSLKVGDSVEFVGPSGRFVLPETFKDNLYFIATGTGISPILSMLDYMANNKCKSNIYLYFGIRSSEDLFAVEFLESLKNALNNFHYTLCFSQEIPQSLFSKSIKGRVTDSFKVENTEINNSQYFLCGNPYMISDVMGILTNSGVAQTDIYHEKFTVSQKPSK